MPSRSGSRRPKRYKRYRSLRRKQNGPIALSPLSTRSSAARDRAVHVLAEMRNDPSLLLGQAARLHGVKSSTVKKYLGSALEKVRGRLRVTKSDRFRVTLFLPDTQGNSIAIKTRSSRERSEASEFLRDLGRALRGHRGALRKWRGKKIAGVELFTDESALVSIEPALSEFSLYRVFNS